MMCRILKVLGGFLVIGLFLGVLGSDVSAQGVGYGPGYGGQGYYPSNYYANPYYYPGPTVVAPLLLPRTGSNDYLYQYDNVYGAGASAAGRMSHVTVNPQPQLFYPRQPRVFIGY